MPVHHLYCMGDGPAPECLSLQALAVLFTEPCSPAAGWYTSGFQICGDSDDVLTAPLERSLLMCSCQAPVPVGLKTRSFHFPDRVALSRAIVQWWSLQDLEKKNAL
jgi:hypothetical protein